jgi:CubicO group peptidase (beta-lactamase class C family)
VADKCDPIRSKLHDLEGELKNTDRFLAEPETDEQNPPKPRTNPKWTDLVSRIAKTRSALQECAESLLIRRWTVTGDSFIGSIEIDALVSKFMKAHAIRAMSVAVAREGTLIANRGYTWAEPNYPITQPDTLFRVASVSKIFTCAAIDRLVTSGALSFETRAFPFLGVTRVPLQVTDRDIDNITVKQLAMRRSGLQRDFGADFRMIASLLGQSVMPTREQLVRYIFGVHPLDSRPGTFDSYSNSAFAVLTSIVEKASGRTFIDYLRNEVLPPFGIHDVQVGATAANMRKPNEVSSYDDPGFSPSQTDMAVDAIAPNAYGGTFALENGEGEGGLIMSTGTVARFLATHAVWDIGPRQPGFTRYGKFSGTGAAAVSRPDGLDFAYAFNYQVDDPEHDALVKQIHAILDRHLSVQPGGVVASISRFIIGLVDRVLRVVGLRLNP